MNSNQYVLRIWAPDAGWLTVNSPRRGGERLRLGAEWNEMTSRSVVAAKLPPLNSVSVDVEVRPRAISQAGTAGSLYVAEDIRPTLHEVYRALAESCVIERYDRSCLVDEALTLGVPTGEAGGQGYLVLTLREVADG